MGDDRRQRLGWRGEELACRELRRRGYEILARRYRTRLGEIDVIARDGSTLVFVEVKARRTAAYGSPADAVTIWKRRRIAAMAAVYLARHGRPDTSCRFDVVVVEIGACGRARVELVRDAFSADG